MKNLILYIPKYHYRFLTPWSFLVIVFGVYLLVMENMKPLGGGIAAISFVLTVFFWFFKDEDAVVIINQEGIFDQRLQIPIIQWRDIVDAHIESKYNNHYICVKTKNPDYYLNKMTLEKRQQYKYQQDLGFTYFNINLDQARDDLFMVLELIDQKIGKKKP